MRVFLALVLALAPIYAVQNKLLTPGQVFKARRSYVELGASTGTTATATATGAKAPAAKNTPGTGCGSMTACDSCTAITFCLWKKKTATVAGACVSEIEVIAANAVLEAAGKITNIYGYYKDSCTQLAGEWTNAALPASQQTGVDLVATEDNFNTPPLMLQPNSIASQDEARIFQGGFPRSGYGLGELGYKAQGITPGQMTQQNYPASDCPGAPLTGCLHKPVIVPASPNTGMLSL